MGQRRRLVLGLLGAFGIGCVSVAGCDASKATEIVPGFSTQVRVPRDLKTLRVEMNVGGSILFCRNYQVFDGKVRLPRTLGMVPTRDPATPVTISILGFQEDIADLSVGAFNDCGTPASVTNRADPKYAEQKANFNGGARVVRRSRQPYDKDHIRFLPMPMRYGCFDQPCGQDQTCKGGRCVDALLPDVTALPLYSEDLWSGKSSTCFSPARCMPDALPPRIVDIDKCIYQLPGTPGAPAPLPGVPDIKANGSGLNVKVSYDGGFVAEVLDLEKDEGFFIPDPAFPQRFQLAPGLCDQVKGVGPDGTTPTAHRITNIVASGLCPSKTMLQPMCEEEVLAVNTGEDGGTVTGTVPADAQAEELKSAESTLMVLLDRSGDMRPFFTADTGAKVLGLSLGDPVFRQLKVGFALMPVEPTPSPANATTCAASATTLFSWNPLNFPPKEVKAARDAIALKILPDANNALLDGQNPPVLVDLALDGAYKALATSASTRRAVLLIGNRDFADHCGGGAYSSQTLAAAANASGKIITYVALADRADKTFAPQTVNDANTIANSGVPAGRAPNAYDLSKQQGQVDAYNQFVADLATCVYALPSPAIGAVDTAKQEIFFDDPVFGQRVVAPSDGNCREANQTTANGWNIDGTQIRLCGQTCTRLRDAIKYAAAIGLSQTPPHVSAGVPIYIAKKQTP